MAGKQDFADLIFDSSLGVLQMQKLFLSHPLSAAALRLGDGKRWYQQRVQR